MRADDDLRASALLPGWTVYFTAADTGLIAYDPNYQATGICVQAGDADELVERVRALVAVIDLARRAVEGAPSVPSTHRGLRGLPRVDPTTPGPGQATADQREKAVFKGYTGDTCGNCGSMSMRRNGACLVCDECGVSTGCS